MYPLKKVNKNEKALLMWNLLLTTHKEKNKRPNNNIYTGFTQGIGIYVNRKGASYVRMK